MSDKTSHTHDAQSDENDGAVSDKKPDEQSRKNKGGTSESTSAQQAQDEQDRQLETGEENPG
jgi:hypothetical protein